MAIRPDGIVGRWLQGRLLTHWKTATRAADYADLAVLRAQRQQARQLRTPLQELTAIADDRLGLPRIGSNTFTRPGGTQWAWRPQAWRGTLPIKGIASAANKTKLGREVGLYHDCKYAEIVLRQVRNSRENDMAPYGLNLDVFEFGGNFLSLVIELPETASEGLRRDHLMRLAATIECERPIAIEARLNMKYGPNTEQIALPFPTEQIDAAVEYDLAYGHINEKRVDRMWVDLMFSGPSMNLINIRDLNLCRYPRAQL